MDKIPQELLVHYQYDYELYGLQTIAPEYKLAWELNRALSIGLKKAEDIALEEADRGEALVSNFIFTTAHRTFRLLRNQAFPTTEARAFLLPELSQWNYFLQVQDPSGSLDHDALLAAIRALTSIRQVARIAVSLVEHKENLLF